MDNNPPRPQNVPDEIDLPSFEEPSKAPAYLGIAATLIFVAVVVVGLLIIRTLLTGPTTPRNELENRILTAKSLIQKNPEDVNAHIELGAAYIDWGRYDSAETELKEALRLAPASADAHYLLALTYDSRKNSEAAIRELKIAVKQNPAMDIASYRLGELYIKTNKTNDAIKAFQKVLKTNPSSADALYQIGLLYEKQGKKNEAVASFKEALKYIPEYPEVKKALQRVQGSK